MNIADSAISVIHIGGNMAASNCLQDGVCLSPSLSLPLPLPSSPSSSSSLTLPLPPSPSPFLSLFLPLSYTVCIIIIIEASEKKAGVMTATALLQRKLNKGLVISNYDCHIGVCVCVCVCRSSFWSV